MISSLAYVFVVALVLWGLAGCQTTNPSYGQEVEQGDGAIGDQAGGDQAGGDRGPDDATAGLDTGSAIAADTRASDAGSQGTDSAVVAAPGDAAGQPGDAGSGNGQPADAAPVVPSFKGDLTKGLTLYVPFDDRAGTSVARDASGKKSAVNLKSFDPNAGWKDGRFAGAAALEGPT